MRGSVSGSEWRDTLALTPVSSSIHSRSPSLSHTLPLHSPFLSRTVTPSIHSVEGETVCKREGEWEWVEGESV